MSGLAIAALITAIVALFGAIGGVIKWASGKFERLSDRLEKVKDDHAKLQREHTLVLVRIERFRLAFQMVASELSRKSPGNVALVHAKALLDEAFKVDLDTPEDMAEQLDELDSPHKGATGDGCE